jgi:hypothetical protein
VIEPLSDFAIENLNHSVARSLNLSISSAGSGCSLDRRGPLVVAFFIGAGDHRAGFQILFDQIFAAATGTLFRNRLVAEVNLHLG